MPQQEDDPEIRYVYEILDSLRITSLQASLYRIYPGYTDTDEYILLLDENSHRIYPILFRNGWDGPYNHPLSPEIEEMVLKSKSDKDNIEPTNFSFWHLEAFLNQSSIIEKNGLSMAAVDSIFQFYLGINSQSDFHKIKTVEELDSIASRRLQDISYQQTSSRFTRNIELLKAKVAEPNIFIYYGHSMEPFLYFEITSSADFYQFKGKGPFQQMFNLKVLGW